MIVCGALVVVVVWLGIFPRPVINTAKASVAKTLYSIEQVSIKPKYNPTP
jgi:NADH:ubiquinone oxidoreductase subunit 4 (subunit M)